MATGGCFRARGLRNWAWGAAGNATVNLLTEPGICMFSNSPSWPRLSTLLYSKCGPPGWGLGALTSVAVPTTPLILLLPVGFSQQDPLGDIRKRKARGESAFKPPEFPQQKPQFLLRAVSATFSCSCNIQKFLEMSWLPPLPLQAWG